MEMGESKKKQKTTDTKNRRGDSSICKANSPAFLLVNRVVAAAAAEGEFVVREDLLSLVGP